MKLQRAQLNKVLDTASTVCNRRQVNRALNRLAAAINRDYKNTQPVLVVVMKGGMYTMIELAKRLKIEHRWEFIHFSRYQNNCHGGEFSSQYLPQFTIKDQDIIIVDDILDRGQTLLAIKQQFVEQGAASVASLVLAEKQIDGKCSTSAEYIGLKVPNKFLIGCGLDYCGYFRNLPQIIAINP